MTKVRILKLEGNSMDRASSCGLVVGEIYPAEFISPVGSACVADVSSGDTPGAGYGWLIHEDDFVIVE